MSPRNRFMLIGGIAGAVLGAIAAYTYFEQQQHGLYTNKKQDGRELRVEAGTMDFVRLGMAAYALLRQVQGMAKPV